MSDLYLGAYWPARQESVDACADRLLGFLSGLPALDPALASWYVLANTPRKSLKRPVDFQNRDSLRELLLRGRIRTDIGTHVKEELGFSADLWNGRRPPSAASFNVTCGLYAVRQSKCAMLDLPEQLEDLREQKRMARVLRLMVRSWEPDWASVISRESRDARNVPAGSPVVDWMTYLSDKSAPDPNVPQAYSVERVDNMGSLIVVQEDPIDPRNSEHLQRVTAVEAALGLS